MRRPGFLAASEALLLLLAVSLGYCDAKRTLKVVSILVSELFTLQKKITAECPELELVSVLDFCPLAMVHGFESPLNSHPLPVRPLPACKIAIDTFHSKSLGG